VVPYADKKGSQAMTSRTTGTGMNERERVMENARVAMAFLMARRHFFSESEREAVEDLNKVARALLSSPYADKKGSQAMTQTKLEGDIVERLRDWADDERCKRLVEGICEDLEMAANEIERRRAGKDPSPEERDVGLTWDEIADMDRKSTLPRHAEGDIVERLRETHAEIVRSDDGDESPLMAMIRKAADEIERLRMLDMAAKLDARNEP
jgi:hypothetical protein